MIDIADRPDDPYLSYLFTVEVEGVAKPEDSGVKLGFSEVSGLVFETEVETLRVGGRNDGEMQLAGPIKYPSRLILKRGLADRSYFWDWYLDVMDGIIERRSITITMNYSSDSDSDSDDRPSWCFLEACPVKWTGPDLRAASAAVGFESIELIHRGLQRDH